MRSVILILFLCALRCFGVDADLYLNFEGIANGTQLSTAVLGAGAKTNGTAVTFATTITGSATGVKVVDDTAHAGLLRPVTVAGVSYANSSPTKALLCDSSTAGNIVEFNIGFVQTKKASYGFSITLTNWGNGFNFYNPGGFESGGTYGVTSMQDNATPQFGAETNSAVGTLINVGNFTIWVTALWDSANGKFINAYYNQTNMVLLGYSTGATAVNATVNSVTFGVTGSHTFTANRNYYLNNLILYTNGNVWPVWPGSGLQVPTNSTLTAFNAAVAASTNADHIILPATNQTWTSGATVSSNSLVIYGLGGTNGTQIIPSGGITTFNLQGDFITLSNLWIKGTKPAAAGNYVDDGILVGGNQVRVCYNMLSQLRIGIYGSFFGLADHNRFVDCIKGRNIFDSKTGLGSSSIFSAYYPVAYDSTNWWVWEQNQFWYTPDCNTNGALGLFSSQMSAAWIFRHNDLVCSNSAIDFAEPFFDMHGDDVAGGLPQPAMGCQVYSNRISVILGSANGKAFDMRGTRSMIYSNDFYQASGTTDAHYREEFPAASPNYHVTGSYVFNNLTGPSHVAMSVVNEDSVNIVDGVDLIQSAPTPILAMQFPHPLQGAGVIGGNNPVYAPSRIRAVRLRR